MPRYAGRGVHYEVVRQLGAHRPGGLAEGETLDLPALCEEFDVSLTALREAMKVLSGKGLIDARQKRGTYVLAREHWNLLDPDILDWRVDGDDAERVLRDLAEPRSVIEPAVAYRAAVRRTDADLSALEAALNRMAAARGEVAAEADAAFHRALLTATGNELFARMDMLLEPGLRARDRLVHSHGEVDDPVPSHRTVFDAVRDGDATGAELAMLAKAAEDLGVATSDRAPGR